MTFVCVLLNDASLVNSGRILINPCHLVEAMAVLTGQTEFVTARAHHSDVQRPTRPCPLSYI